MTIDHAVLGKLSPVRSTFEPFNPLRWLTDPGNLDRLRRVARAKYCRDVETGRIFRGRSCSPLVPRSPVQARRIRLAAEERALDAVLCRFLDRDYRKDGLTDDEPARAVLEAIAVVRMAGWRHPETDQGCRQDARKGMSWSGSAASRGDDPARIVAAVETAPVRYRSSVRVQIDRETAREAICGRSGEEIVRLADGTPETVEIDGGQHYPTVRRMVSTTTRTYWRDEPGFHAADGGEPVPFRFRQVRKPGGWRMVVETAHRQRVYPADTAYLVAEVE